MNILALVNGTIHKYRDNYIKANTIIRYYKDKTDLTPAEHSALAFVKRHRCSLSNNKLTYLSTFIGHYHHLPVDVHVCGVSGLSYVNHKGKRLFFPRHYTQLAIKSAYRSLLMEQDEASPHVYWSDKQSFAGKTLFDLGAAEGFVSLDHIDDLERVYLFECEHSWMEALKATFEPYSDKVTIVERYVSDRTDADTQTVSLDDYVKENGCRVDLVKMDIEGFEEKALSGARETLMKQEVNLAVCVYHKPEAATDIVGMLSEMGYSCVLSSRLMCFIYDERPPYFRPGIVNAHKKTTQQP